MLIMKLRHSYSIDNLPGLKITATVGGFLAPCFVNNSCLQSLLYIPKVRLSIP